LQPKIASGKAQSADRSHSAVKLCNAAWHDSESQPAGTAGPYETSTRPSRDRQGAVTLSPRSLRILRTLATPRPIACRRRLSRPSFRFTI